MNTASRAAIPQATAETAKRRRLSARHREWIAGYLFVLPDALGLLIFVGGPMLLSLSLGFFGVTGFGGYRFVGLANYRRMLADPLFLESLKVTLLYVVLLVPSLYVTGLGLALLVHRRSRFSGLFRTLFFLPHMVSLVVVGLIWQVLLIDKIGVISRVSAAIGLGGLSWLGDPSLALYAIVGVSVWFLMGYYMLLVSTVAAVAGAQTFDLVYVMTKGGPANSTALAIYYIYEQAFQFGEYGYAAAMASVLVVILLAFTAILFRATRGGRFDYD
jgi:multiple sugar transport system permease protein